MTWIRTEIEINCWVNAICNMVEMNEMKSVYESVYGRFSSRYIHGYILLLLN